MSVGENIKKRREAKGLSQAELAGAIGVGQSYLSQIERGTKGSFHTAWEADSGNPGMYAGRTGLRAGFDTH